VTLKK